MSKERQKLIPELRFPEFVNDGEWEEKDLGDICDVTNGKSNVQDHVENGKYPLFDRSAVIKASNDFIFDCEAVIIPGEGMRFIPKYYEGKFNLHQRAYALKDFTCSGQFVYFIMQLKSNLLAQKAVQSTVLSLRLPILQKFPIQVPQNPYEQEKITSCLSFLDEVIAAHCKKIEALIEHKKGLMQNLFPQEGESVPRWRFQEFVKDGEWVEKELIDLALNGFSNGVFNDPKKVGYGYKLINVSDMYSETTIDETRLSSVGISESEFKKNKVEFGDIFFTRSSLVASGIAKSNIYLGNSNDVTFDGHLIRLRSKKELVVPIFLYYLLQTNNIRSQMVAKGKTATMTTIGQSDIASVHLQLPSKSKEQQKIASCFYSLDELIIAQAKKIEQLKLHKKGLMQGLFPKIND